MARRSFWAWGFENQEPSRANLVEAAETLHSRWGFRFEVPDQLPDESGLDLRPSRIKIPADLASICSTDDHDRAFHTYGRSFLDRIRAFRMQFPAPPDVVARPGTEREVERLLEWCSTNGYHAIPFGGGSSVVSGLEPEPDADGVVTIDLERLDAVLEVDPSARAARIQGGIYGPALERELKPLGLTMRHFPQSFEFSTLGGWLATRSGGHYATNHTHIDEFTEAIRMVSPAGTWESRRLPGSGAGPSPDRMLLGSEGALGIITEAWVRLQARPEFRASAGVALADYEGGWKAAQAIAQAKLWPANLRLLDRDEAARAAGMDGVHALLVIGFESADQSQGHSLRVAVEIAREFGGEIENDELVISDEGRGGAGRQGAVGAWRDAFINAPYIGNSTTPLGMLQDTFETAITWDRWPAFDAAIRTAVGDALQRTCGGGALSCRFTHVYPDGPAPYYSFMAPCTPDAQSDAWKEVKKVASDVVIANGGTITHHHAVGKMHRPWYDQQMPDLYLESLKAMKRTLDPAGILNPGVLVDP